MSHHLQEVIKPRSITAHKGDYGRILIIGGSPLYVGAPTFVAMAAYAAGAAAAVGIIFGMHLVRIAEALAYYEAPRRRMRLSSARGGAYVLDDSYNASPLSVASAIETVKNFPAERKIAVLGDMLEIGTYAIAAHEAIGKDAAKVFDVIVTVGPRAKFIAEAARAKGMTKRNLLSFETVGEAVPAVRALMRKGDLLLVKGSRAMHLDELVDELKIEGGS